MASLATIPYDILILVSYYLPDPDFLRLRGVCHTLRENILQTTRVEEILSKRIFFVTIEGLDELVRFSQQSPLARRLKHLVLDLTSPHFYFDFEAYEYAVSRGWRDPNENLSAALKSYAARKHSLLHGLGYGNYQSQNTGTIKKRISSSISALLKALPLRGEIKTKVSSRVDRKLFLTDNRALVQRLEEALRNLPNVSTLEFTHTYGQWYPYSYLGSEEWQYMASAWERFDPHLSQLAPDWRTKVHDLDLIEYFKPLEAECHKKTIYADTLMAFTKAGVKLSQITTNSILAYNSAAFKLSQFHGEINDPEPWIDRYRDVFKNLRVIHLVLIPTAENPALSPVFLPAMENIEVLRITFETDTSHFPETQPAFPFPCGFRLPKLQTLEISLTVVTLANITNFLIHHKDTLKTFRTIYGLAYTQQSRTQLVEFLKELYNHMALIEFYIGLDVLPFTVDPELQYSRAPRHIGSLNCFGIQAYGDWKNDTAAPFQFCTQFSHPGDTFRHEYLDPAPRLKWAELIHNVESIEFESPPPGALGCCYR
ncbi:hypothetical protein TWF506_003095 [Arthrobotrys conoides]|uniref:F-box domain-containing protein n=1 Tax=Arthrobotrys conoides TaxID=74498 RepID=A0AAN8RJC8_9PEZI